MRPPVRGGAVRSMFVFLLLGLFALLATFLVLLGARVYRGIGEQDALRSRRRILDSCVRSMVAAYDAEGMLSVREEEGVPVLCASVPTEDGLYVRRLYCYEGWLRESFTASGRAFQPEQGERLCEAERFSPGLAEGMLRAEVSAGGEAPVTICAAVRTPQQEGQE